MHACVQMEQCELIAVRAPPRIASAAADPSAAADADRAGLPFVYWAGRHVFHKRPGGGRHSRGGSGGSVPPSAESLKLFSEALASSRATGAPTETASAPSTAVSQVCYCLRLSRHDRRGRDVTGYATTHVCRLGGVFARSCS